MPRTLQEIVDHADELSAAFDGIQPDPAAGRDPAPLLRAREAVQARARAEAAVADAVAVMRAAGYSWHAIGAVVGTSEEAARQRYGSGSSQEVAEDHRRRVGADKSGTTAVRATRACGEGTGRESARQVCGEVVGGRAVFGAEGTLILAVAPRAQFVSEGDVGGCGQSTAVIDQPEQRSGCQRPMGWPAAGSNATQPANVLRS